MGLFRSVGRGVSKNFQFKRWLDYDHLKSNASLIKSLWRLVCKSEPQAPSKYKSFAEAQQKFNLSDAEIQRLAQRSKKFSYIMTAVAAAIFVYGCILLSSGNLISTFTCFVLTALALCFAFRESYNYYLITTQQLTSTPRQWLRFIFKRG